MKIKPGPLLMNKINRALSVHMDSARILHLRSYFTCQRTRKKFYTECIESFMHKGDLIWELYGHS